MSTKQAGDRLDPDRHIIRSGSGDGSYTVSNAGSGSFAHRDLGSGASSVPVPVAPDPAAEVASALAALDAIDALGEDETDSDENWAEFFRGIDETRPHRPLFAGRY